MTRVQKIKLGVALGVMAGLFILIFFSDNGLVELLRKREESRRLETATQLLIQENAGLYRMVGPVEQRSLLCRGGRTAGVGHGAR